MKTAGNIWTGDGFRLHYDEYGTGQRHILSAQIGFYPTGVQQIDPPIDHDLGRELRRKQRAMWLAGLPEADPREKQVDYGRPLMRCGTEEKLCEALSSIQTPTLILGGVEDPISTPELMMRTARCLLHCKLVIYSNFIKHSVHSLFPLCSG